jgi:biotin transport system substrate-specific component
MDSESLTIAGLFRPRARRSAIVYDCTLILAGSVVIAVSAQVAVWLPFSPVPVTGQTLAVLMIGSLLGARRGGLSVLAYVAEGAMGLPVFAGGAGGVMWLIGPTGGYLAGFIAAAVLVGYLAERGLDRKVWTTVIAMLAGNICIYAFGVLWLTILAVGNKFKIGVYPFIAGDVVKTIVAAFLLPAGWRVLSLFSDGSGRLRN